MRTDIHPAYEETTVVCGCGNSFTTRSTADATSCRCRLTTTSTTYTTCRWRWTRLSAAHHAPQIHRDQRHLLTRRPQVVTTTIELADLEARTTTNKTSRRHCCATDTAHNPIK